MLCSTSVVNEARYVVDDDFVVDDDNDVDILLLQRKKWVTCFDGVTALIFVAAISEYDQTLYVS